MLAGGRIRERITGNDVEFIEKLEFALTALPLDLQHKVKKLNFFSDAYDTCTDPVRKNSLKAAVIELLDEFIQKGYQPIFVGIDVGYYVYSDKLPIQHLPIFEEILQTPPSSKTVLPLFNGLSARALPFMPSVTNLQDPQLKRSTLDVPKLA